MKSRKGRQRRRMRGLMLVVKELEDNWTLQTLIGLCESI